MRNRQAVLSINQYQLSTFVNNNGWIYQFEQTHTIEKNTIQLKYYWFFTFEKCFEISIQVNYCLNTGTWEWNQ